TSLATRAHGREGWEGPLFLVGVPRSGTKLLRSLLTRHERIRIPPVETEFLPFLASWLQKHGLPEDERSFTRLSTVLLNSTYFTFRDPALPPFDWRDWRAACRGRFDVPGLFEGFIRYETRTPTGSGIVWGDKSPTYVRHVETLLSQFPEARVVHIRRDVRDVVVSLRRAWGKDVTRAAHRWNEDVMRAHRVCARNPTRCIELTYEALIAAPEAELARVCDFLALDFDPKLTLLDRPTENRGDARGQVGVVRDNTGKYRKYLTPSELARVESLAWDTMVALGYRPEAARGPSRLGRLSAALRKLKDGASLVRSDLREKGLRESLRFYVNHQRFSRG